MNYQWTRRDKATRWLLFAFCLLFGLDAGGGTFQLSCILTAMRQILAVITVATGIYAYGLSFCAEERANTAKDAFPSRA